WTRRYEPAIERRDADIKRALREQGLHAESFNGALLFEPWQLATKQGAPYRVFTPFWRAALADRRVHRLLDAPAAIPDLEGDPDGFRLDTFRLLSARGRDRPLGDAWMRGDAGAHGALEVFIAGAPHAYSRGRERPDRVGTSRLSPHLHFAESASW